MKKRFEKIMMITLAVITCIACLYLVVKYDNHYEELDREIRAAGINKESDSDNIKMKKIASYVRRTITRKDSGWLRKMVTADDDLAVTMVLKTKTGNCRELACYIISLAEIAGVDMNKVNLVYTDDGFEYITSQYNSIHCAVKYCDSIIDVRLADAVGTSWYDSVSEWLSSCRNV